MWKHYQRFNDWWVTDEAGRLNGPYATEHHASEVAEALNERDFRNSRLRERAEANTPWPRDPFFKSRDALVREAYAGETVSHPGQYAEGYETGWLTVEQERQQDYSVHSAYQGETHMGPWDEIVPTKAQPPIETREMERGERIEVRSVQPEIRDLRNLKARSRLETSLCAHFGGFTSIKAEGGWVDEEGVMEVEDGLLYSVSFENDHRAQERVELARRLFASAGQQTGQTWVHIEVHKFYALHTKVRGNA